MYLIEILHQTTTWLAASEFLLLLYLIEILHQTTTVYDIGKSRWQLYLIEILHQTTTDDLTGIISNGCILSKFYIKPQLIRTLFARLVVVSYRNSTSNHNCSSFIRSTTVLYLIEILHQTTTSTPLENERKGLYLIEILHQTTTKANDVFCCFLLYLIEILHQTTTASSPQDRTFVLYLIEILHQTTTTLCFTSVIVCCILSKFYIKPQQTGGTSLTGKVVSYRNSTSNHNQMRSLPLTIALYLIEILHQTTTVAMYSRHVEELYLIEILHQTTTSTRA